LMHNSSSFLSAANSLLSFVFILFSPCSDLSFNR
jgi:hypothetical protein